MLFLHERSGHRSVSDCFVFLLLIFGGREWGWVGGASTVDHLVYMCTCAYIYTFAHTYNHVVLFLSWNGVSFHCVCLLSKATLCAASVL